MPDLIFNSENAAASQDRGGLPGAEAATHFPNPAIPVRPVLHASRGVSVSAIHVPVDRAFRQAPPATTRAASARPAGLRIVET